MARHAKKIGWRALVRTLVTPKKSSPSVRPASGRRASQEWEKGGERLPSGVAEHLYYHQGADDRETYEANFGGYHIEFECWPGDARHDSDLHKIAYAAACQRWGPIADTWVLHDVRAVNDAARAAFPDKE